MQVGDPVTHQFGPYRAHGTVIEVTDRGAVIAYDSSAVLVGFPETITAPDGTQLTTDRAHGFVGTSHWPKDGERG